MSEAKVTEASEALLSFLRDTLGSAPEQLFAGAPLRSHLDQVRGRIETAEAEMVEGPAEEEAERIGTPKICSTCQKKKRAVCTQAQTDPSHLDNTPRQSLHSKASNTYEEARRAADTRAGRSRHQS